MVERAVDGDKPTMVSLARELGVSRQTISNVLNNPAVVSEPTRQRVLAAIADTGYRPSAAGRALRTRRSMAIGMRLYPAADGINGAVMDRFLHSVSEQAQAHGYRIVLSSAADTETEIAATIDARHVAAIDAAVLTDTFVGDPRPARLTERGVPFVAFGRPWGDLRATHAWVDVDGRAGTLAATRHLRSLGHERIGFLGWPHGSGVGEDRFAGWLAGMAGSGVEPGQWTVLVEDAARHGAAAARVLRERGATAVVCASDALALGAVSVFRGAGTDLPVIGFDDTPVASAIGLSSVAQPVEDAARATIDLLLALLAGRPAQQLLLEPRLVLRHLEAFAS